MKTITIPNGADPFIVTVNNTTYTYRAGATVSVPDDVADVIENMIKTEYAPYSNFATDDDVRKIATEVATAKVDEAIGSINTVLATLVTLGE